MYVQRNIEALSRIIVAVENNKLLYIFVCVCSLIYPACKARALSYIVNCGLSECTACFHIISYTVQFSEKEVIEYKMCFDFVYNFV